MVFENVCCTCSSISLDANDLIVMGNMIGNAALSMIIGTSCEIYIVFELGLIKRSWYNNDT